MSTEGLTRIPPPGWPKAVVQAGRTYRISRSRRRWARELAFLGQRRGVYYSLDTGASRYVRYIFLTRDQAEDAIAPEALPKWLRVSEGL